MEVLLVLIGLLVLGGVFALMAMKRDAGGRTPAARAPQRPNSPPTMPVRPAKGPPVLSKDFDRSAFVNDAGGFAFPKYSVRAAWVKVIDNTAYREIWSELTRAEKLRYSIADFEEQFSHESFDVEVVGFWEALEGAKKSDLGDLGKLAGQVDALQELWQEASEIEEGNASAPPEPIDFEPSLGAELTRLGAVIRMDLSAPGMFARWLDEKTVKWLQGVAREHQLATSGSKAELVQRVSSLTNVAALQASAYYCTISPNFSTLLDRLSRKYVERIKEQNAGRHPLYMRAVWDAALGENSGFAPHAVVRDLSAELGLPAPSAREFQRLV